MRETYGTRWNPIYSILESPYRWLILAALSFVAGLLGALMFIAWGWSHNFIRVWFWAGILLALYFCWRAFSDWKAAIDSLPPPDEQPPASPSP